MDETEYEEDNKGNSYLVKSINCDTPSMIRLYNRSFTKAEIYWINYDGKFTFYKSLNHSDFLDLNTFTTHPWIFKDAYFGERLLAGTKFLLRGSKVRMLWNNRLRIKIPWRDKIDIVMPMRTLKNLAMKEIVRRLNDANRISDLRLPSTLNEDLTKMLSEYQKRKDRTA